jgi:hypothetical protein
MMPIPLFRLEEHHEAFIVWHHAVRQEWLYGFGNVLLHVDEHSDWGVPRLSRAIESIRDEMSDIIDFTYSELHISDFIWPAIYQGLFSEVTWLRHRHSRSADPWRMMIRPINKSHTEFVTGLDVGTDERTARFAQVSPEMTWQSAGTVVLDIDIDYFCSNPYPDYDGRRIEVTRTAYEEFVSNRYHFLRLAPGSRITGREEAGRCYLCFNDFSLPEATEATRSTQEQILSRMDAFVDFLQRSEVIPRLVITCRSQLSGYTPSEHCAFIEKTLLERLAGLYPLEIHDIDEIAPVDKFVSLGVNSNVSQHNTRPCNGSIGRELARHS